MKTNSINLRKRYLTTSVIILLFALLSSCSKSSGTMNMAPSPSPGGGGNPPANSVTIQGFAFSPSTLTVAVNTTVTWTNLDSAPHTVTSDSPSSELSSASLSTNGVYTHQFTAAGTFKYHCAIHPTMTGTVIVQ